MSVWQRSGEADSEVDSCRALQEKTRFRAGKSSSRSQWNGAGAHSGPSRRRPVCAIRPIEASKAAMLLLSA